jgi:hypothetical protein
MPRRKHTRFPFQRPAGVFYLRKKKSLFILRIIRSTYALIRPVRRKKVYILNVKMAYIRHCALKVLGWGHTSARGTYVATHILHDGRCWGHHTARVNLAGNSGGRMQLAICCHEKTWRQWDIHGKTQTRAKTTKRWSTVKDETAVNSRGQPDTTSNER